VEHDAHRRPARRDHSAHRELRVVTERGRAADRDRVEPGAQPVYVLARRFTGDPLRAAGGVGNPAVDRRGELEGDERSLHLLPREQEGCVQRGRRLGVRGRGRVPWPPARRAVAQNPKRMPIPPKACAALGSKSWNCVTYCWSFPACKPISPTSFTAARERPPLTNTRARVLVGLITTVSTLVGVTALWNRMLVSRDLQRSTPIPAARSTAASFHPAIAR